jgi:PAS domain S-box-containing protein
MGCVINKAENLLVLESDSHFADFTGIDIADIKSGALSLLDLVNTRNRETVKKKLCQRNTAYVYADFHIKNKNGDYILVHCIGQNVPGTSLCRLAMGDVSQSEQESRNIQRRADNMNALIDLVEGGVCLFKVTQDMNIEPLYMNAACCRFFGTAKDSYRGIYRIEELIFSDDKSAVYQAIGNSMATKKPIDMELRVITHRDSFIWCKFNSAIHSYAPDGCPVFHAVFTDITKIKEAEQEADAERDTMVSIFKQLPGPLFYTQSAFPFKLEVVTEDFTRLTGYSRQELFEGFAGDLSCIILAEDFPRAEAQYKTATEKSDLAVLYYRIKTKSGKTLEVIDRRRLVDIGNGKIIAIGIIKDPTATQVADDIN